MALTISLSLMLFQQFSGINAVIFYAQSIFDAAGSTLSPALCTIIVGVVQVVMTVTSAALIEKAGRRILVLQSCVVMGLCLVVLGVYFQMKEAGTDVTNISILPLGSVVLFIISFSLGLGPIPVSILFLCNCCLSYYFCGDDINILRSVLFDVAKFYHFPL